MNLTFFSTILGTGLFFFTSCQKDVEVDKIPEKIIFENTSLGDLSYHFGFKSLITEYTSTGCPGCGSWGKPTFYSLIAANENNAVPIAAHIKYGDPMITEVSNTLGGNRTGANYTPQIWVNNQSIMVLSGNSIDGSASVARANDLIKNAIASTNIGLAGILKYQNGKVATKYGVKLMADLEKGDYYLSSYLMEDGLLHNQAGVSGGAATHNYVIRQAANGAFGHKIVKEEGKELEADFEFEYTENTTESQYLVNILWKKIGNIYIPVNAQSVK